MIVPTKSFCCVRELVNSRRDVLPENIPWLAFDLAADPPVDGFARLQRRPPWAQEIGGPAAFPRLH